MDPYANRWVNYGKMTAGAADVKTGNAAMFFLLSYA